jgi:hypothetical protein
MFLMLGRRVLFSLVPALAVLALSAASASASETCPNEAIREEQHSTFLPDCRAYEMVSPPDKLGHEIMAESSRTHAAAAEAPGLPAALTFPALGGFADAQGTGIAAEYMAERDGTPGTSGWTTHAITPAQDPLSYLGVISGGEPNYMADMSSDLTAGIFRAWSPLTSAPNVMSVPNLYLRSDLRSAGSGAYGLLSDAVAPLPAPRPGSDIRQQVAATSSDFEHVLFETKMDLTADASGTNVKLYKSDDGVVRLVAAGPGCPGASPFGAQFSFPCAAAGQGAFALRYTSRTLSSDGSRVEFTAPVNAGSGGGLSTTGAASKIFQLDDRGTPSIADDALVQVDASEASVPGITRAATFETASTDGSRVFFITAEQLTDTAGGGLYMWERQPVDEQQSVTVDATGGTFALTAHAQPSHGTGTLTSGSVTVTSVSGSFSVGQTISGAGIPVGTRIVAVPSSTNLTLSAAATASGSGTSLSASVDATTSPLAFNATAAQVQSALEGLSTIGTGNVTVTGGPGDAGGTTPYVVTFTGGLAGVDIMQITADGSALTGGGAAASVLTTRAVHNLTLIASTSTNTGQTGVLGASTDGHRVYFATAGDQLVSGAPPVFSGLYYWQDAEGAPGGTLSFVGDMRGVGDPNSNMDGTTTWSAEPEASRVTPDGRTLVFEASDGSGLRPRYDSTHCVVTIFGNANGTSSSCSEVYVYRAAGSTPTEPDVVCASCNPSGAPATATAWLNARFGASATTPSSHLNHVLSDDGRYVFFSTAEALVAQDTNGKSDVYEYDVTTGRVRLLSSGTDTSDSYFLDASADGRDAYFLTREQLAGWDTDNANDVYDARVGGGLPEPTGSPPACEGEACHGPSVAPPSFLAPLSAALLGEGNPPSVHPSAPSSRPKPLTPKQRLAVALRACHRKPGIARRRCERTARRRYISSILTPGRTR